MRKLKLLFVCLFVASISLVSAQTGTISGTVLSTEDGGPVIGAAVQVKGDAVRGTTTDANGRFSINASTGTTLVISSVGYVRVEVPASQNMRVLLDADIAELDDIVIDTAPKSSYDNDCSNLCLHCQSIIKGNRRKAYS